jgi:hypothetical protein
MSDFDSNNRFFAGKDSKHLFFKKTTFLFFWINFLKLAENKDIIIMTTVFDLILPHPTKSVSPMSLFPISTPFKLKMFQFGHLGVDVMITNFCDFDQFLSEKLAFFSKSNVMIKILHNLALFRVKTTFFRQLFWRKYLNNHNIGPWSAGPAFIIDQH